MASDTQLNAGFLLSLEGVEGSGKSTQCAFIAEWCRNQGWDVVISREPGGTALGVSIRRLLLSTNSSAMHAETELLLLLADRCQHYHERIFPAMQSGKLVVTDRFIDSSLAYQGVGRRLGKARVRQLHQWLFGDFRPHLSVLFDIPVALGLRRKANAEDPDRFEDESLAFHEAVHDGYQQLLAEEPGRFRVVNAQGTQEEIQRDLRTVLIDCVGARKAPAQGAHPGIPGHP